MIIFIRPNSVAQCGMCPLLLSEESQIIPGGLTPTIENAQSTIQIVRLPRKPPSLDMALLFGSRATTLIIPISGMVISDVSNGSIVLAADSFGVRQTRE